MTSFQVPSSNLHTTSMLLMNKVAIAVKQGYLKTNGRCRVVRIISRKIAMVIKIVAFSLAFFFVRVWEYIKYPVHLLIVKHRIKKQIEKDIKILSPDQEKMIREKIQHKVKSDRLEKLIQDDQALEDVFIANYASSYRHYGPVVLDFVTSLFDTAKEKNYKLVFLARDGLAPYAVAKILQEQHPEKYGPIHTAYVYFSRKVVSSSQSQEGLLAEYLKQQGIEENDRCIFVDVGFQGSMIGSIKKQLASLKLKMQFKYLVSHTDKARGFMATMETPLASLGHAGFSRAAHWLEGAHQGVIHSATKLVRGPDGKIYPNSVPLGQEPSTWKKENPVIYMIKHFCIEGVLDYAREHGKELDEDASKTKISKAWRMASESLRKGFDEFLGKIYYGDRYLYLPHH